jgi:hypothetical protein
MTYDSDYFSYRASVELGKNDPDFYGLVMAAMRKADSFNAERLRRAFPEVWDDLQARYNAPGGILDSDPDGLKARVGGAAT